VVEAGAQAPVCTDPHEDWVRAPISRNDLEARVRALQNRLDSSRTPSLDSTGTLCFGNQSITMSNAQVELMVLLIEQFEMVVYRHELEQRLAERVSRPTRNSLDLHIMRLRRRLSSIGLIIRTVWGRGYVLEPQADGDRPGSYDC
jgi:DNA-binding response OmpR family regulator